jgi:zinc protease
MGFLQQGGLQAHTLDELQSLMAGRSVELGLAAGADSFGGSYSTTPEDLELQMQVAAAFLTAPGLRPDADQLARAQLKVFYPTLGATPAGVFQRDVARLLRSGDVRFGIGPLDELLKRSLSELGPVLARSAREGDVEIAIVGDVTEEAAIAAVAKTFGALPQRQASPLPFDEARKVAFPADRSPRTFAHTGQPNQALALVYWPTTDDSNVRLARTLSLLRAVMRLKLTETLREELGATYSPNAGSTTSDVFPGYGFMSASSEVEPDKIDAVYAAIDTIAASLASGGITEDERKRALTPILESIEESLEDNGTWLNAISRSQTRPTDLDRFRSRKADFEAITVAELTAAARTYLKPDAALRVRIVHTSVAGQ